MIPPRRTVLYCAYAPQGRDSHGTPIDAWGVSEQVSVYAWAPAATSQPIIGNRRPVTIDVDLLVPLPIPNAPRSHWILQGQTFEQVGEVEDFTTGPRPGSPGGRIKLRKVTG
jgi:hypothetical protein